MARTGLLYIGNKLSRHGSIPTSIETLGPRLAEHFDVTYASDVRSKPLRLLHMIWALVAAAPRPGVVLIDTYSGWAFYYALVTSQIARLLSLKYIPILRGGDLPERLLRDPGLSRMIFGHAFRNVTPSAYLLEALAQHGYPGICIPNNIDLGRYEFRLRCRVAPRLLYVRALHRSYNPALAVRVLHALLPDHADAELCMVGPDTDGSTAEVLRVAAELGVAKRVRLTGRLSKEAWIELSREFDIFLNTADYDNHPVSMIEAMALGFPVVSTRVGGIPYLVRDLHDALLVERGDPKAMAGAVRELLGDPDLAERLSRNARQTAERFDWPAVQQLWLDLLGQALGKRPVPAESGR